MDFEFTTDQLELRDNARSVLTGSCPPALVREVFEGAGDTDKLWDTLVELGWPAISIDEAHGGLGLSFIETGLVVEELARVVAPSPFLATVTQFLPIARHCADESLMREVAEGHLTGALGVNGNVTATKAGDGWVLNGTATHVLDGATADRIAVIADGGAFIVARDAVTVSPRATIDPTMPLADITFKDVAVDDAHAVSGSVIDDALGEATTAMALSTVATCRAIFEMTLAYAKVREQFGKPIGSFQALKHRFANMYLAVEKASSLAYFAALTIAEDDERRAIMPSVAKASASECQRLVVTDGLQLHGGIGFTWENDLHFWLKRAKTTDFLFGNGAAHRGRLAKAMGLVA